MNVKVVVSAIVGGVVITLLTGLIPNMPEMLVGATWYGYPLAWLSRLVLAPEYFPWRADSFNLAADIVFWVVILGVVLFIAKKVRK